MYFNFFLVLNYEYWNNQMEITNFAFLSIYNNNNKMSIIVIIYLLVNNKRMDGHNRYINLCLETKNKLFYTITKNLTACWLKNCSKSWK